MWVLGEVVLGIGGFFVFVVGVFGLGVVVFVVSLHVAYMVKTVIII